jgi:hypothetical protein
MSICFRVNDCKLSHCDPKVIDEVIRWLRHHYECIFEDGSGRMTVSRGKIHTYLGMTLDYTVRGHVKISMFEYVDEILPAIDKVDPRSGGTKTSARPRTCSRLTMIVRS